MTNTDRLARILVDWGARYGRAFCMLIMCDRIARFNADAKRVFVLPHGYDVMQELGFLADVPELLVPEISRRLRYLFADDTSVPRYAVMLADALVRACTRCQSVSVCNEIIITLEDAQELSQKIRSEFM